MTQFMEDHPGEEEAKGEECSLIVILRNEKPQTVEVLTQPTLDPEQDQQDGYKPKKSLLRGADLSPPRYLNQFKKPLHKNRKGVNAGQPLLHHLLSWNLTHLPSSRS